MGIEVMGYLDVAEVLGYAIGICWLVDVALGFVWSMSRGVS